MRRLGSCIHVVPAVHDLDAIEKVAECKAYAGNHPLFVHYCLPNGTVLRMVGCSVDHYNPGYVAAMRGLTGAEPKLHAYSEEIVFVRDEDVDEDDLDDGDHEWGEAPE